MSMYPLEEMTTVFSESLPVPTTKIDCLNLLDKYAWGFLMLRVIDVDDSLKVLDLCDGISEFEVWIFRIFSDEKFVYIYIV